MLNILYVDDDTSLLEICKIFLESHGEMSVDTAVSVQEAHKKMGERQYDAIVSDFEMPFENGIQFLKQLRAAKNPIPFIIFTGKGREEIVIEAFNSGADSYIQKGGSAKVQFTELAHKIKKGVARFSAEQNLERSISVLRATLESTADGVLVVDHEKKIMVFNQKFLHMWDISEALAEEQDSRKIFDHISRQIKNPEEYATDLDRINDASESESYNVISLADGRIFRQYSQPQKMDGLVIGRVFSFRDATTQHRAETELRAAYEQLRAAEDQLKLQYRELENSTGQIKENEERFRLFSDMNRDGIGICIDGKIVMANNQLSSLLGVPEMTGHSISGIIKPGLHRIFQEHIRLHRESPLELTIENARGDVVPVEIRVHELELGGKRAYASIWRDLSDRKTAEKTLAESEEKYRNVFRAENNPLLLIDYDTFEIRDINDAACQTYGYFRTELIGKNILDLCTESPHALNDIRKKKPGVKEYFHRRKDGSVFPVEVSTAFFVLNAREVFIYSIRDITQNRLMEEALKLANIKLNLLLGITRHDVLNKLSILVGYNELLLRKIQEPDQLQMLETQRKAAYAIRSQIEFTREYENLGSVGLKWLSINDIVTRSYDHFLKTIPLKCTVGTLEIYADPMIEKVFYNLFDNAFRYGDGITQIKVFSERKNSHLILTFEDDGIGIPPDEKEKIFLQGYGKNTGLGLFLTREILSITNMKIQESGEFQNGARFEIDIPPEHFRFGPDDQREVA